MTFVVRVGGVAEVGVLALVPLPLGLPSMVVRGPHHRCYDGARWVAIKQAIKPAPDRRQVHCQKYKQEPAERIGIEEQQLLDPDSFVARIAGDAGVENPRRRDGIA